MKLAWKAGLIAYESVMEPVKAATGGSGRDSIPASRAACYAVGMSAWTSTGRLITAHRNTKEGVIELFTGEEV